jgi:lysyl-tRNA synthetase class 2
LRVTFDRIDARFRFLTVRQSAALAVAVLATEAVVFGMAGEARRQLLFGRWTPPGLLSQWHVLAVLVGLALLALTPRLWRGTRTAVPLAIGGLLTLAALNLAQSHLAGGVVELALAGLLAVGRSAFPVGCRNRPRLAFVCTAVGAWGITYCALRVAPLVHGHAHGLVRALHQSVTHTLLVSAAQPHLSGDWNSLIDVLVACAAVVSVLAIRSLLRPVPAPDGHVEHEYRAARAIVERHGDDSLSPFTLRPDKALHFAAGGVLSYRVIRGTAIVSADPVGPDGAAPAVLASFLDLARRRGWQVALWGASSRHLDAYRALGLRAVRVGEEAFVDPQQFTLEGRPVRKLRQSVHRVSRRGWDLCVREGREIDSRLEAEIDALDDQWRRRQRRLLGFAMGMGAFESDMRPDDLYVLARSPQGELGAVMRFVSYCGKLSLDTMRRVGDTPNGLNEALVCRALEIARERGIEELSLNYAGLAHLVRSEGGQSRLGRLGTQLIMRPLSRRFQMERLVRFNEKFSPEWRPRYLVYESRAALPRSIARVLQAEGYLRERAAAQLAGPAQSGTAAAARQGRRLAGPGAAAGLSPPAGRTGHPHPAGHRTARGIQLLGGLLPASRLRHGRLPAARPQGPVADRSLLLGRPAPGGRLPRAPASGLFAGSPPLPGLLPAPRQPGPAAGLLRDRQHERAHVQSDQPAPDSADDPDLPGRPHRRQYLLGFRVGRHPLRRLRELRARGRA